MNYPVLKFRNLILRISPAPLKKPGAFAKTGAAATTDAVWYKDLAIGVAYTVNDSLSISFNRYTSQRHNNGGNWEQETDAFNIGYTLGGMTIGFQDATTDNAGWSNGAKDDTRTLGVSVAF